MTDRFTPPSLCEIGVFYFIRRALNPVDNAERSTLNNEQDHTHKSRFDPILLFAGGAF